MVVTRHGTKGDLRVATMVKVGGRREIDQPLRVAVALPLASTELSQTLGAHGHVRFLKGKVPASSERIRVRGRKREVLSTLHGRGG